MEMKMSWVMVQMELYTMISKRPTLSPTLFEQLEAYVEFKVDFHNVSICARWDLKKVWYMFPYLVNEAVVQEIMGKWPWEWPHLIDLIAGTRKGEESSFTQMRATQKQKESEQAATRWKVAHQKKEVAAKAAAENECIMKETMMDVEESAYQHTANKEGSDEEGSGGKE